MENPELQRIPVAQLESLPLAAPHRKAVNILLNNLNPVIFNLRISPRATG
jgi:hypothetical protein